MWNRQERAGAFEKCLLKRIMLCIAHGAGGNFLCYKICEGYHMLLSFSTSHQTFSYRCPDPTAAVLGLYTHKYTCSLDT